MNKHMDLLANLKTMVETRKISGTAMMTLDSYNERSQVNASSSLLVLLLNFSFIPRETVAIGVNSFRPRLHLLRFVVELLYSMLYSKPYNKSQQIGTLKVYKKSTVSSTAQIEGLQQIHTILLYDMLSNKSTTIDVVEFGP